MAEYPLSKRQQCALIEAKLLQDRSSFEDHWKDLAMYSKPRRIQLQVTDKNKGAKVNKAIIDSTASDALQLLVANLSSGMSSSSVPWIELVPEDQELKDSPAVKQWFQEETAAELNDFQQSNLYGALATVYGDAAMFATAAMAILEDDETLFRCYPYPIGSYAFDVDPKGEVDTFFRKTTLRVIDLVQRYGEDKVSTMVKDLYARKMYNHQIEIAQCIVPNVDYDPEKLDGKYRRFVSWVYECGSNEEQFLEESGFEEFPVVVAIWERTEGDIYGTECPGMRALGDIKQLQAMTKKLAKALDWAVDPAWQVPTSLQNQRVTTLPGEANFFDETQANKGMRPLHQINLAGLAPFIEEMDRVRQRINNTFYKSIFLLVSSDQDTGRTATEIFERRQEKLMAMGPILNQFVQFYNKMIDRIYGIRWRAGLVAPPPDEAHGQAFRVNCTSIVAQAQKAASVDPVRQLIAETASLAGVDPTVLRKVDIPKALEIIANARGVPVEIVRTDEEYQALVAQDRQQAQAQAQADQLAQLTTAGKNLGTTPMGQGSALDQILQGAPA